MSNQNPFYAISYSASLNLSNAQYRDISTGNDIALSKVFSVKIDGSLNPSEGYILLRGSLDDGKILRLPFKRVSNADIAGYDDIMFMDVAGNVSVKSNGVISVIFPSSNLVIDYGSDPNDLPDPTTIPAGYTTIVKNEGNLKWYDSDTSSWKTITST